MKTYLFIVAVLVAQTPNFAQEISRTLIGSGGEDAKDLNSNIQLTWSVGELSTEFLDNQISLQQGFLQGDFEIIVKVAPQFIPKEQWEAYPNPTDFYLYIKSPFKDSWIYSFYDPLGRRLFQGKGETTELQLTIPALANGMYWLTLRNQDGKTSTKKIFIKQY